MREKLLCGLALLALLSPALAQAQPAARIDAVQMPAWVERGAGAALQRIPAAPGMELEAGDQVKTGQGARLLLKLAEGSSVKLGEQAVLRLDALDRAKELFRGTLSVLEGAFRFTTDALAKYKRRDININVSQVTAGIRGTDLWGRSSAEHQIVCLIEGAIEVTPPNETTLAMDKPLQFYQRENGKSAPLAFISPDQLQKWAAETEIERGKGAARSGGRFSAVLGAFDNQNEALRLYDALRTAGYAAEIRPSKEGDKLSYAVRIGRIATKQDADSLAAQLKGKFGAKAQ